MHGDCSARITSQTTCSNARLSSNLAFFLALGVAFDELHPTPCIAAQCTSRTRPSVFCFAAILAFHLGLHFLQARFVGHCTFEGVNLRTQCVGCRLVHLPLASIRWWCQLRCTRRWLTRRTLEFGCSVQRLFHKHGKGCEKTNQSVEHRNLCLWCLSTHLSLAPVQSSAAKYCQAKLRLFLRLRCQAGLRRWRPVKQTNGVANHFCGPFTQDVWLVT